MNYKILPQEGLKLIACVTMLLDHIGYVFFPKLTILRMIGRIAFPIYCFLLAEGAHYTKVPGQYALRLGVGLVLAEIPYDLALFGRMYWGHQNVMFTLLLGFAMAMIMKRLPLWGKPFAVIPFAFLAYFLNTDYGALGVVMIAVFVIARELPNPTLTGGLGMALVNLSHTWYLQPCAIAAMLPISLYSGKKATRSKTLQLVFYLFYPVHLLILWLLKCIL